MADDTDTPISNGVGYTTRDLVIQANAKLDGINGDMKELRAEQAKLRSDVDALQTAQAVGAAKRSGVHELRTAVYALLVLAAYWFGPVIDKAITH